MNRRHRWGIGFWLVAAVFCWYYPRLGLALLVGVTDAMLDGLRELWDSVRRNRTRGYIPWP